VTLFSLIQFTANQTLQKVILLGHIVIALAIIAQASSAKAFDMWENGEFESKMTAVVKSRKDPSC